MCWLLIPDHHVSGALVCVNISVPLYPCLCAQIKREDDTADSSVLQLLYKEVDTEEDKVYWDRNDPNAEEAFDEIMSNAVHMFDPMAHPIDKESFAFVSMWAQDAPVDLDCMLEYVPNYSAWLMPS